VEGGKTWFDVDAAAETLSMTTASHWAVGTRLNLERALKIGDELGGHIVAGHADGIATIQSRDDLPDMARFELRTTRELARFVAAKGSVTLDGVSLTVNTVQDVAFSVLIVPHTLTVTTLSAWRAGSEVNIEVDLMARYAARLAEMK
jgi:riboflavin synthase